MPPRFSPVLGRSLGRPLGSGFEGVGFSGVGFSGGVGFAYATLVVKMVATMSFRPSWPSSWIASYRAGWADRHARGQRIAE